MHTTEAIKRAVRAGYKPRGFNIGKDDMGWNSFETMISSVPIYEILLDIEFWKALAIAENWGEKTVALKLSQKHITRVRGKAWERAKQIAKPYIRKTPNRWKREMHSFIDHIIAGGDYDSFFKQILKW